MIKNKVLSIFLLVLGVFFLNIPFVIAKEDIEIRDVRIVESNEGFTVDNLNFEKNNIHSSNVVFENVNDFVTYEIEFENNSDEDYVLKSIDSNIKNDNINMESDGVGTVLGKNSTKLFRVKYEYNKELQNQNNITLNDISFRYNFNSTKELVNPLTKNNLLIILSILLVVGIVTLTVKSKKKALLLFLLVLIPVLSNAEEGYSFNMLFDDVEIKGRFLDYEVNVYDNGSIIDSYNKQYGQEINDLPNVTKDGYDFDKWIDQDNNIINDNTVVTKDLDINSKYDPIEYDLNYDLKDGKLDNPNPTKYTIEDDIVINNPHNDNTFSGWNEEDSDKRQTNYELKEDKGDKTLIANFSDNPEVDYTVIHRKQNTIGVYEEYEREELKCAAHTEITPQTKKYAGYISPVTQTKEISEDGLTTFTYDYSISQYSFNITDRTYINSNSTIDGNYNYKTNITVSAKNRAGYSFKWSDGNTNYDRNFELTSNTTLTPIYTPNTDIPYKVVHKIKSISGNTFEVKDENTFYGTVDTLVTPKVNYYEGFISPEAKEVKINGDGSTVVEYLYTRNEYSLTIEDAEFVETTTPSGLYVYGTEITVTAKERPGYTFVKWSNEVTNPTYTFNIYKHTTIKPIYSLNDYKINFDYNGGTGEETLREITPTNSIGTLPTGTREGYYLDGWYTEMSSGTKVTDSYIPSGDMTMYARWNKSIASATISNEVINIRKTKNETISITNANEIEEEYTFTSNNEAIATVDSNGKVTGVAMGTTTITIKGNTSNHTKTVTVNVLTNEYGITFNANGGTISSNSKVVIIGEAIGELPTGTREGYYLDGWYTSSTGGTKVTEAYVPEGNEELYARWKKSVASANISNSEITIRKTKNETINITNKNEIEETYTFTSNNTNIATVDSNGKVTGVNIGSTTITIKGNKSNHTKTVTVNVITNEYVVTFDANGGTISSNSKVVTVGDSVGTLPTGTKEGYYLDGWYTAKTSGDKITTSYTPEGDVTIYAHWKKSIASAIIANQTIELYRNENKNITISNANEIEEDYTFTSNNESIATVNSNGKVTGVAVGTTTITIKGNKSNATKTVNISVVLREFTITFDANGGTPTPNNKTVTEDQTIGTLPTVTKDGYYFDGWYTESTNGEKVTTSYVPTSNKTLYARWKKSVASAIISNEVINIRKTKNETINITNKNEIEEEYTFTSNDTSIATVDSNGKVTGVAMGTTTITVKGNKSNHTKTVTVNVLTNEYGITFNDNGGTISFNSKVVTIGEAIGELPTGTKEGYYLDGWYTSLTNGVKVTEAYVPENNTELFAIWKKSVASATLQESDIELHISEEKNIVITNAEEIEEEYTFTSEDESIATVDQNGTITGVEIGDTIVTIRGNKTNETKTVNISVVLMKYTITFDANGGVTPTDSKEVTEGTQIGELPTPTKSGFTFQGWYTLLPPSGVIVDETYVPTNNITLYAKWEYSLPVSFAEDDWNLIAELAKSNQILEYYNLGDTKIIPMKSYGNVVVRIVNASTPNVCLTENFSQSGCGLVLEFKKTIISGWLKKSDSEDGNGYPESSIRTRLNDEVYNDFPDNIKPLIVDTHVISTSPSGPIETTDKLFIISKTEITGSRTYYNGGAESEGSDLMRQLDYYKKMNVDGNSNTTICKGTSDYWIRDRAVTNYNQYIKYQNVSLECGSNLGEMSYWYGAVPLFRIAPTDSTLYPKYNIQFNMNGGTASVTSKSIIQSTALGVLPEPTKEGYYFDGWYTSNTYETKVNSHFVPNEDMELFARWKKSLESATIENSDLSVGVTDNVTINITNANEIEEEYTFESNDTSIATVGTTGIIKGVSVGKTSITITGLISGYKKTVYVTVSSNYTVTYNANGGVFNNSESTKAVQYSSMMKNSHTSNVDDDGIQVGNYGNFWENANIVGTDRGDTSKAHVITIPRAKQLSVAIFYNTDSRTKDWASIWEGSYPQYTAASNYETAITNGKQIGGYYSSTRVVNGNFIPKIGKNSFTITGDTVTFSFKSNSINYGGGYGYYAIVTGISADKDLDQPTKDNKTFAGWYKDVNCTDGKEFNLDSNYSNITVYAKWT